MRGQLSPLRNLYVQLDRSHAGHSCGGSAAGTPTLAGARGLHTHDLPPSGIVPVLEKVCTTGTLLSWSLSLSGLLFP